LINNLLFDQFFEEVSSDEDNSQGLEGHAEKGDLQLRCQPVGDAQEDVCHEDGDEGRGTEQEAVR
jgi:hypothetical protein